MNEFKVKLASSATVKKYDVFKLHKDDQISWTDAKMRRENEHQPWQIKCGSGRASRRFKAIKEGGVGDNTSYFVFYKPKDQTDTYEVCPIEEWYSVSATQRYKTLTAEEAEQKFEQRHKMFNLFSVMHLKKNGDHDEEGGGSGYDSKAFKVSELDDWDHSGDDDGSNDGEDDTDKKSHRKKSSKKEKDDPEDAPDEAKEESDEGDFEQREVDYMSDSSSDLSVASKDDKDGPDVKGIAEEEALRDLLSTDDEEDGETPTKVSKTADNRNSLGSVNTRHDQDANESDESSDSDDYDVDDEKIDSIFSKKSLPAQLTMAKPEIKSEIESSSSTNNISTRQPASGNKRKAVPEVSLPPPQPAKRPCTTELSPPANGQEKIVEDLIKKYLTRKPMTLKLLLKDVRSKLKRMEGLTPESDLVGTIAAIIKRLQPDKQRINDVVYFSLKS